MTHATRPPRPLAAAERPQPATMPALTIPSRFCGPPGSGNGGYVCGRIAAYLDGQVTVTLRQPPPLATPLAVERGGESSVRIHHGGTLIGEAASSPGRPVHGAAPSAPSAGHAPGGGTGRRKLGPHPPRRHPDRRGSLLAGPPGAGDTGPGLDGGSSRGG